MDVSPATVGASRAVMADPRSARRAGGGLAHRRGSGASTPAAMPTGRAAGRADTAAPATCPAQPAPSLRRAVAPSRGPRAIAALALTATLTACASQVPSAVQHGAATPGFLLGVWHGFIFPVAWLLSLVMPEVAIYAVPNTGGWYDFGFFLGIMVFGVGARHTRTVYVTRRRR